MINLDFNDTFMAPQKPQVTFSADIFLHCQLIPKILLRLFHYKLRLQKEVLKILIARLSCNRIESLDTIHTLVLLGSISTL